jgi:methylenetetrahydrofolate reductase (NADPH)
VERTFRSAIDSGRFIVTGELGPPLGAAPDAVRKKAAYFRGLVDAVNTTDNQSGVVRMSSIATAKILLDEGIDPIVQMTCRDRNRIALQSDILGAAGLGIRNLLLLTGDHMAMGNQPDARPVFDLDSIQLIEAARAMRGGRFMNSDEIKRPPDVLLGGAANPFAEPMALRLLRIAKKVEAGVDFIQTQAVYDVPRFERWMTGVRDLGLHERAKIIPSVLPARSAKALKYMSERVAGMLVPEDLVRRVETADEPEEEGLKIACETIARLREIGGVSGIHLTPVMWEKIMPRLVEESGLAAV